VLISALIAPAEYRVERHFSSEIRTRGGSHLEGFSNKIEQERNAVSTQSPKRTEMYVYSAELHDTRPRFVNNSSPSFDLHRDARKATKFENWLRFGSQGGERSLFRAGGLLSRAPVDFSPRPIAHGTPWEPASRNWHHEFLRQVSETAPSS